MKLNFLDGFELRVMDKCRFRTIIFDIRMLTINIESAGFMLVTKFLGVGLESSPMVAGDIGRDQTSLVHRIQYTSLLLCTKS